MPRPRTFNEETALDAAVQCFWKRGLEGTSIRELGSGMGLAAPSVYNAFGDKRSLFLQALERYAATTLRPRLARLEAEPSPKAAVRTFFRETIARSLEDTERRGCFLINSALDAAPHDPAVNRAVSAHLGEIEAFFRVRIAAARDVGEIDPALRPHEVGRMLFGLLIAVRVLARTGAARAELESMVRPALAMLDRPTRANQQGGKA